MKSKIEEIVFLAREKGFEAKTLSTKFTMNAYLGINKSKTFLINETCDYLLLAEMQKWLREKHNLICLVYYDTLLGYYIEDIYTERNDLNPAFIKKLHEFIESKLNTFKTNEECLEKLLQEALKLI